MFRDMHAGAVTPKAHDWARKSRSAERRCANTSTRRCSRRLVGREGLSSQLLIDESLQLRAGRLPRIASDHDPLLIDQHEGWWRVDFVGRRHRPGWIVQARVRDLELLHEGASQGAIVIE